MKIKSIKKHEDNSRLINVNFVTSMIENTQVSIGMKYFVIEYFNKGDMRYDVETALDEETLVENLAAMCYGMKECIFYMLVKDIVKETPKFCYVYDNIWKHVLANKYYIKNSVKTVEDAIEKDINAYHNCKLYDLLVDGDKKRFESNYPVKEKKNDSPFGDGKMYPTDDYAWLYDLLWDWFNTLTNGKYELVDGVLYNKAKKAEDKLSILKYKELSAEDLAEITKVISNEIKTNKFYHNDGTIELTTSDSRKIMVSEVDTIDLAVALENDVWVIGDYIMEEYGTGIKMFTDQRLINDVHLVQINDWFRKALNKTDFNENRFYEYNHLYGKFGYKVSYFGGDYDDSDKLFITTVNEKSIKFVVGKNYDDVHKKAIKDETEKRKLVTERIEGNTPTDWTTSESFNYFGRNIKPKDFSLFTPEKLIDDARDRSKQYYDKAVEAYGEPKVDQEVSEQELVVAASAAL